MAQNWENTPIHFDNQDLKRFCVENFGGENGITDKKYGLPGVRGCAGEFTFKQAAAVTNTEGYVNLHLSLELDVIDLSMFVNVRKLYGTLRDRYNIQRFVCPPNLEEIVVRDYFLYQYQCRVVIPKSVKTIREWCIPTLKEVVLEEGNEVFTQTEEGYIFSGGTLKFMPRVLDAFVVIPTGTKRIGEFVFRPNMDTLVIPPTVETIFASYWWYQIVYGYTEDRESRYPRYFVIFNKSLSLAPVEGVLYTTKFYVPDKLVQWYKDSIVNSNAIRNHIHPISEYPKLDYLKTKINIEEYGRLD